MEVGARRGAHFQLGRRGGTPSPITWRNSMKPRLIPESVEALPI